MELYKIESLQKFHFRGILLLLMNLTWFSNSLTLVKVISRNNTAITGRAARAQTTEFHDNDAVVGGLLVRVMWITAVQQSLERMVTCHLQDILKTLFNLFHLRVLHNNVLRNNVLQVLIETQPE